MKFKGIMFLPLLFFVRGECFFNERLFECKIGDAGLLELPYGTLSGEALPYVLGRRPLPDGLPQKQLDWFDELLKNSVRIKHLDLGHNELTTIPAEIAGLINLEKLVLRGNGLTTIPAEVFKLEGLRELDLSNNKLTVLPLGISGLKTLERLNLSMNNLTMLPAEIIKIEKLRDLNLSYNPLQEGIVDIVCTFKNLKYLQLPLFENVKKHQKKLYGFCERSHVSLVIDDAVPEYLTMKTLDWVFEEEIKKRMGEVSCPLSWYVHWWDELRGVHVHDSMLDFSDKKFDAEVLSYILGKRPLPQGVLEQENIKNWFDEIKAAFDGGSVTILDLSNLPLGALPPEISNARQLRRLVLGKCRLTKLPDELFELGNLEDLDISNNKIDVLTPQFEKLDKLTNFEFSNNPIRVIPKRMRELNPLRMKIASMVEAAKKDVASSIEAGHVETLYNYLTEKIKKLSGSNPWMCAVADEFLTWFAKTHDINTIRDASGKSLRKYIVEQNNEKILKIFATRKSASDDSFVVSVRKGKDSKNVIVLIENDLIDEREEMDAISQQLGIAIMQKCTPVIVSRQLFTYFLKKKRSCSMQVQASRDSAFMQNIQLATWSIYKTKQSIFYVLIPSKNGEEPRLQDYGFLTDALMVTRVDDILRDEPAYRPLPDDIISDLKVFEPHSGPWNFYLSGHGKVGGFVAGVSQEVFRYFIEYLAQTLNVFFVFYTTCFGGGVNLITTFMSNDGLLKLPFTIAQAGTTETVVTLAFYSSVRDEVCPFAISSHGYTGINFEGFFDELSKTAVDWSTALYNLICRSKEFIHDNFPLIRYKGDEFFQPLIWKKNLFEQSFGKDKIIVMTTVKSRAQKRLAVNGENTRGVLWYPAYWSGALRIDGEKMPLIVSMNPEYSMHVIEKIEAPDIDFRTLALGFLHIASLADRIFFIKRLVCKFNDSVVKGFEVAPSLVLENIVLKRKANTFMTSNYYNLYIDIVARCKDTWFSCRIEYLKDISRGGDFSVSAPLMFSKIVTDCAVFQKIASLLSDYEKYAPFLKKHVGGKFESIALWQEPPRFMAAYVLDDLAKQLAVSDEVKKKTQILRHLEDPRYEEFRERFEAVDFETKFDPTKTKDAKERLDVKTKILSSPVPQLAGAEA